ncbi:MAG: hypothetical protein ACE361_07030 [Aureliella sp.]
MQSSLCLSCALILVLGSNLCPAEEPAKLLFEDDFERSESQETAEELGNGWGTNSKKRAAGNKQCDLRDGYLYLSRHAVADHGVSLTHRAEYVDCRIEITFRLDDRNDDIGIDFADMQCKEVHAGHICKVMFRPTGVEMLDFKYGRMKRSYRDLAKAGKATKEQQTAVAKFQRKFPCKIATSEWHRAVVTIQGETMSVKLNGKPVGQFESPGMGHDRKDMVRFSARKNACLDDVRMFALNPHDAKEAG